MMTRRSFLKNAGLAAVTVSAAPAAPAAAQTSPGFQNAIAGVKIKIRRVEPLLVRYSTRGTWMLVRVYTDQGVAGMGEGFSGSAEAAGAIRDAILQFSPSILGASPLAINALVQKLKPMGKGRIWTTAIAAVEIACWDIAGKVAGKPIYDLLGGALRTRIPVYQSWGSSNLDQSLERMVANRDQGVQMLKCDPFVTLPGRPVGVRNLDLPRPEDIQAMEKYLTRLREALGTDYKIACDGHWKMSIEGAKTMAKAMEPFKPVFFEEPSCCPNDPRDLKAVADSTSIPIAAGEHFETVAQAAEALSCGVLRFIQPEVSWNCGILETFKMNSMAEGLGARLATHGFVSPISIRAASHVNAVAPNLFYQEHPGISWQTWKEALCEPPDRVENGEVVLPDAPGLGLTFNEAELRKRIIAS